jgi:hypothetical protein
MRLRAKALVHCLDNARLADTRLARDQHDTAVATLRLRPAPHFLTKAEAQCSNDGAAPSKPWPLLPKHMWASRLFRGCSLAAVIATSLVSGAATAKGQEPFHHRSAFIYLPADSTARSCIGNAAAVGARRHRHRQFVVRLRLMANRASILRRS